MLSKRSVFLASAAALLAVGIAVHAQDERPTAPWPFGRGFNMHWPGGDSSANANGTNGSGTQDGSTPSDGANGQNQSPKQQQRSSAPSEPTRSRLYGPSLAVRPGVSNGYAPQGTGGTSAPLYGTAPAYGSASSYGTAPSNGAAPLRNDAGNSAPLVTRGDAMDDAPAVVTPRDSKPQIVQANPATTRRMPSASPPSGSSVASSLAQDLQSGDTTPRDSRSLQERLAAIRRSAESAQPTVATPDVAASSRTTDAPLAAAPATSSPAISEAPLPTTAQVSPSKSSPPPAPSPFVKSAPLVSNSAASTPAVVAKTTPPTTPSPLATNSAASKPPIVSAPAVIPAPLAAAATPKYGPSSRRAIPFSEKDDEPLAPPHKEALAHDDAPRSTSPSKTASVAPPARIDSPFEATAERSSPQKSDRIESSPFARSAENPFAARDAATPESQALDSKNLAGKGRDDKFVDDKGLDNLDNKPLPSLDGNAPESTAVATKVPQIGRDSKSAAVASVSTTKQSPAVSVETSGPRTIVIGKEATYLVTIKNSGDAGAQDLTVTVKIPEWTDVAGAQASAGATRPASDNNEPLQWKIPRLEAHGKETLTLRLLPRKGRGFDLAVQWSFTPIASQTMVEVQEPKLNMSIAGPDEVIFGQSKLYRLTISNPGTGDAESVVVQLDPIGSSTAPPSKHPIGTIHAGDSKVVELELTARQTGTIAIHAAATAEPGLKAEAAEDVLVRRAAVALGVEGPRSKYAGTLASYSIHVSNPGNATAENVRITATLPQGSKFISASAGGQWKADQSKVIWSLPALRSSGETSLELKCALAAPGPNRLQVNSAAAGDVSDVANITTNVEALADLKLEVTEPAGPIAVGDEVSYEVHIRNRGSKAADAVAVVIYFSDGLEPVAAQGNPYDISNGVVAFRPLASVAANGEAVLKIKAKADRSGKQVFRAEVECGALGTKLASSQEMVVYGGDDAPGLDRADRSLAGRNPPLQSVPNRLDEAPKPLRR